VAEVNEQVAGADVAGADIEVGGDCQVYAGDFGIKRIGEVTGKTAKQQRRIWNAGRRQVEDVLCRDRIGTK
jgi:hypothetical protein